MSRKYFVLHVCYYMYNGQFFDIFKNNIDKYLMDSIYTVTRDILFLHINPVKIKNIRKKFILIIIVKHFCNYISIFFKRETRSDFIFI